MQRVKYLERQILTAEALNQEQAYRLESHRRHNLANHDWGILQGLHFDKEDHQYWLARGVAVDGYGRELFVSQPFPIRSELFTALYSEANGNEELAIDLWLRYARQEKESLQRGKDACDPDQRLRSIEEARLCATRPPKDAEGNLAQIDPRRPSAVPPDDLDFPPFREPPDDPARPWPVYLGRLRWRQGDEYPTPDNDARLPYAILVGAVLRSASRQPAPEDPQALTPTEPVDRARVEMAPVFSGRPPFSISCADPKSNLVQRIQIQRSGNIRMNGQTTVVSNLSEDERLRMPPEDEEQGKLSILRLSPRATQFTGSMITNPKRLAERIIAGALPLRKEVQEEVNDYIRKLFEQPLNTPDQKQNLRQNLAGILNNIAKSESLAVPSRLRTRRLSKATWGLLRSAPEEAEHAPPNARIIAELLSGELPGEGLLEMGHAIEVTPLGLPETTKAMPWSIYHIRKQEESGLTRSTLRLETLDPGDKGDPTLYRFAIGKFEQPPGAFVSCLSVDSACQITIHGMLIVKGELIQSPVKADPNDPRFIEQLVQGWNQAEASALTAKITSITAIGTSNLWSYDLTIENKSTSTISNILVLDTFSIRGITSPTTQRDPISSLGPGASTSVHVNVPLASRLPVSGVLYLIVSVQGQLPNGKTVYATAKGQTTIQNLL